MKTGKHYFGLLTREEKANFKKACKNQGVNFDDAMTRCYSNIFGFIRVNLTWGKTKQGYEYWDKIANSKRTEPPNENHLAQFQRMFLYLFITFVAICLLMIAYKAGYDNGRLKGFNEGRDFGTMEVQTLMGYDFAPAESIEQYEEMIKQQRK